MGQRLVGRLLPWATLPTLGGLIVALLLLYSGFRWRAAYLTELSEIADPILDGRWSYSAADVAEVVGRLGAQGRTVYAISELTLDLLFPALYTVAFSLLMLWVMRPVSPIGRGWQRAALLPFAILACDYAENLCLVAILLGYPATLVVAPVANAFTVSKWTVALACAGVLLVMGARTAKWMLRRRVAAR